MGFELDPLEWTNRKDVEGCIALDEWQKEKKITVTVNGIKEVHRYYEAQESTNSEF